MKRWVFCRYLTQDGNVFMERVAVILNELGEVEDEIFKKRQV
jgi:5'-3' exonuclease